LIRSVFCWLFHRAHHVALRREGDWSLAACAKCEEEWIMPRLDEHARFGAVVHSEWSGNPTDLDDWAATRDGYDPGEPDGDGGWDGGDPVGRGRTKHAAIRDLLALEEAAR
jgi:hypothetical protein